MIREDQKLQRDVAKRIPELINQISQVKEIVALYTFGSLSSGELNPLSDLDFGVLVSNKLGQDERFDKHLELIGLFNKVFETDEIDLILMNDAPMRFSYNIIRSGKLLFCADSGTLTEFIEKTVKVYLDFRYFRDEYDKAFLKGIGYYG